MDSRKASITVVLLVITSICYSTLTILPENVRATTLFVGGAGPNNHTSIQEAIDASFPGDTIYVYSGTYHENVIVNRTLSLIGEDKNTTTINGSGSDYVVQVTADWVNITHFTVTNGGSWWDDAGIGLYGVRNTHITNNNISSNLHHGIHVEQSENVSIVRNKISSNSEMGIRLYHAKNVTIVENEIRDNSRGLYSSTSSNVATRANEIFGHGIGIQLFYAKNFTIEETNVFNNRNGIWMGLFCENVLLSDNRIHSNTEDGIHLKDAWDMTIIGNNVSDNDVGISMVDSKNITVSDNHISNNRHGVYVRMSEKIEVYHNSFINNTIQASDEWGIDNSWDGGYPSGGNHWADYLGWDECSGSSQNNCPDPDDIGDIPYSIDAGVRDRYPLLPYGPTATPPLPLLTIGIIVGIVALVIMAILIFLLIRRRKIARKIPDEENDSEN